MSDEWFLKKTGFPISLGKVKEYVDFLDQTAQRLASKCLPSVTGTLVNIQCVGIGYLDVTHPAMIERQHVETYSVEELLAKYEVAAITFAVDLMDTFGLLLKFNLVTKTLLSKNLDPNIMSQGKFHVRIELAWRPPPRCAAEMIYPCNADTVRLKEASKKLYVERVVCKVRILLMTTIPDIERDIGGPPAALKVGKSFICKSGETFNQFDSDTWDKTKGIGNRWRTFYCSRGYTKMCVPVAVADNDLSDCIKKYDTSVFAAQSMALAIEDALGRPRVPRSYVKDRATLIDRPMDGTLIGYHLDNDQSREHVGRGVAKAKDAYVVYIVYRPTV